MLIKLHSGLFPLDTVIATKFIVDTDQGYSKETAIIINNVSHSLAKVVSVCQPSAFSNITIPIGYISGREYMHFIASRKKSFGAHFHSILDSHSNEESDDVIVYNFESEDIPSSVVSIVSYHLRNVDYISETMFGVGVEGFFILSININGSVNYISLGEMEGLEDILLRFREENSLQKEPSCSRYGSSYDEPTAQVEVESSQHTNPYYYTGTISSTTSPWHLRGDYD